MENKDKKLTKIEKIAIILNVIVFAIVVVSGVIRILVECGVIRSFKDSLAYSIIDGIFILIAVILLVFAYIYEKKIKRMVEEDNIEDEKTIDIKPTENKNTKHNKKQNNTKNKVK